MGINSSRMFSLAIFICLTATGFANGECPSLKDIPIMYDESHFMCKVHWRERGGEYSVTSCNGDQFSNHDHTDVSSAGGFFPMGSIAVKVGCTLYMWMGYDFTGVSKAIVGPEFIYDNTWGLIGNDDYPPGPLSYKCRCIQEPINCEPEDQYEVIISCDNLLGVTTAKCSYQHTIGTEFSESVSEGMSIDASIKAELELQFWEIFKANLGFSASTGYDWTHTSQATQNEQVTVTVEAEAPPGMVLMIEQAVGHCGGSEAKTEMIRLSHQDTYGNIVHQAPYKLLDGKLFQAGSAMSPKEENQDQTSEKA